jgi:polo-like kinase 1
MHVTGEGSEYCVKFERSFEDTDNIYLVVELCMNQSLNELLKRRKRLTEIEAQCYIKQLIKATEYLHSKKIIHRE